jgi:diguanylate cyclase (GGDEF)-like protein/PAS domain S-box-containing protein
MHQAITTAQFIYDLIGCRSPLDVILSAISTMVEEQFPDAMVSVMLYSAQTRTLTLVAGDAFSQNYRQAMRDIPIGPEVGSCGAAACLREIVVCEDLLTDSRWVSFIDLVKSEKIAACWSAPIISPSGELLGTFATYYRHCKSPELSEITLIRKAAGLAALAIEHHAERDRRVSSEQRYRSLFSQHPDCVFEIGLDGRFVDCNPAAEVISGYGRDQLVGEHFSKVLLPEFYDVANEALILMAGGESHSYEIAGLNASGEAIFVDVINLPIVVDGDVRGGYGIARDISERKKAEDRMRLLERGIEASPNGVVMLDASVQDYPMVYVNPAFTEMSGYQPEEAIGKGYLVLFGKGTAPEALRLIRSALEHQEECEITLLSYRKNGSTFWKKLTITPVYDGRGECTHYIAAQQDVTRQLKSEELLDYQARHDPVTGLPNHRLFEAHLSQVFVRARGKTSDMVLLYVDLDDFKSLNESLGRQVGDLLLAVVADRLRNLLANDDVLTRLAADEFVIMRPALQAEAEVKMLASQMLTCLAEAYDIKGQRLSISASIGIASDDGSVEQPKELLDNAALAVREAKRQGGNTFCWNHGAASTAGTEQVMMRCELMEAIEARQFVVYYQPLVEAKTGRLRSAEALVRWNHPVRGLLLPGAFISLAEQTGQIVAIGRWVLHQACMDMAQRWRQTGQAVSIAVNISPLQFRRPEFIDDVLAVLEASGLPPELLELEVTEGVLLSGIDKAISMLESLRDLGVQVAIDDFGTGFSSLSYLRQLPITKVKLDRSFIIDVTTDRGSAAIVQGVITMAHHLGLLVVAEGIETVEQQKYLAASDCDLLQGFLYSRPVPLGQFALGLEY